MLWTLSETLSFTVFTGDCPDDELEPDFEVFAEEGLLIDIFHSLFFGLRGVELTSAYACVNK